MGLVTKDTLSSVISKKHSLSKKQSREIIETILEEILLESSKGNVIRLRDFGSFRIKTRSGRSPWGKYASKSISFKLSSNIKRSLNGKGN